jgi:hypothetical protein
MQCQSLLYILLSSTAIRLTLLCFIIELADSPALPGYFSGSEAREYAPVLRIPGDRFAGYYQSDLPGYSDLAPDRKTDLPDTYIHTYIQFVSDISAF